MEIIEIGQFKPSKHQPFGFENRGEHGKTRKPQWRAAIFVQKSFDVLLNQSR
jgi:hypothetical protein